MDAEDQFSQLAGLIGEPTRAKILWNLLDGRAFTATELSLMAEVSPQGASMHLSKLVAAGLLRVESQGRYRYYSFSSRDVAYAVEAIANLMPPARKDQADASLINGNIKYCRSCYDHMAGKIGVTLTDQLLKHRIIVPSGELYEVTPNGRKWFAALDISIDELKEQRRHFAKPCLDWTERRHHLAGSLGAALLDKMLQEDWIRTTRNSRALVVTGKGEKKMQELLGVKA